MIFKHYRYLRADFWRDYGLDLDAMITDPRVPFWEVMELIDGLHPESTWRSVIGHERDSPRVASGEAARAVIANL